MELRAYNILAKSGVPKNYLLHEKYSCNKAVRTSLPQKMPIMKFHENQDGLEMNQLLVQVK
jgi:hypothetical protein